jgi:hypothetical protein
MAAYATPSAQGWNRGLVGTSVPPRTRSVFSLTDACPEAACGTGADLDEGDPLMHGWVQARVVGSTEPPRWFCSGKCAARGVAKAELRMSP